MRLRPRFSVRTLAIVVTLVCAYFAAWEATRRYGVPEIYDHSRRQGNWPYDYTAASPFPFIVKLDEQRPEDIALQDGKYDPSFHLRTHYLWVFGVSVKTPVQWEYVPSED